MVVWTMAAPVSLPVHGFVQQLEVRETSNGKLYMLGKVATERDGMQLPFMVTARTYNLYSGLKVGDKVLIGEEDGVKLPVLIAAWVQEFDTPPVVQQELPELKYDQGTLQPLSVRVDDDLRARIESLSRELGDPQRGSLLRLLLLQGVSVYESRRAMVGLRESLEQIAASSKHLQGCLVELGLKV